MNCSSYHHCCLLLRRRRRRLLLYLLALVVVLSVFTPPRLLYLFADVANQLSLFMHVYLLSYIQCSALHTPLVLLRGNNRFQLVQFWAWQVSFLFSFIQKVIQSQISLYYFDIISMFLCICECACV